MRNQTAHRCQLCATQLLNGKTSAAPHAYTIAYTLAAIGAPGANNPESVSSRGVSLSSSGMQPTIVIRLKKPKLPMAWMPIIRNTVAAAHTTLGQPGKNAKNGIGISARNMNHTIGLSSATGSFCTYQPSHEGSGCQIRKPLRYARSLLLAPRNFCLPKPNITRNTISRQIQASAGAGAATAPSAGSGKVAGRNSARIIDSNSSESHGKISPIAMSSDR